MLAYAMLLRDGDDAVTAPSAQHDDEFALKRCSDFHEIKQLQPSQIARVASKNVDDCVSM
jgi:hypothetical protein